MLYTKIALSSTMQVGFALPTVIIASVIMLVTVLASVQASTAMRNGLTTQYYNRIAREAAEAGLTRAMECVDSNGGQAQWSESSLLRPDTDCGGQGGASFSEYVISTSEYRSTFAVHEIAAGAGAVRSDGIVELLRSSDGSIWRTYTQSVTGDIGVKITYNLDKVASGGSHSCGISGGIAYCWGAGGGGRLGNGSTSEQLYPVAVGGLLEGKYVTDISAGTSHTCAVADGEVFCWGTGTYGKLGYGGTDQRDTPVKAVGGLNGKTASSVSVGERHSCAVANGSAYCWGDRTQGRLGDNTSSGSQVYPSVVSGSGSFASSDVTAISAGTSHTCAVANGSAYCWGLASYGTIGNGSTTGDVLTPFDLSSAGTLSGKTVTAISAGNRHTCAVANGTAHCWGYRHNGRLGDGSSSGNQSTPVAVSTSGSFSGLAVTDISAGSSHTCAVADGGAYCWGQGSSGQLGSGADTDYLHPNPIDDSENMSGYFVTDIAAGNFHTCATANGRSYCWGNGASGQLGDGDADDKNIPVAINTYNVTTGGRITNIANGQNHSCGIKNGRAYCWGYGWNGQLGNGSTANSTSPTPVDTSGVLEGKTVTAITARGNHTCALANGEAFCWGNGTSGQLGNGSSSSSALPVAVNMNASALEGGRFTSIKAGMNHTCGVSRGRGFCWGDGSDNKLGGSSTSNRNQPYAVPVGDMNGRSVAKIDAGNTHTCAIANGAGYCWGAGTNGRIGNNTWGGTISSPTAVWTGGTSALPSSATLTDISTGSGHTCVVANGSAYCWGYGWPGQIGNGSTTTILVADAVDTSGALSEKSIESIVAGSEQTCAVADGNLFCWGNNNHGVLGDDTTINRTTPVAVNTGSGLGDKRVSYHDISYGHACALASGEAYCWGSNSSGRLGINSSSTSDFRTPQKVAYIFDV